MSDLAPHFHRSHSWLAMARQHVILREVEKVDTWIAKTSNCNRGDEMNYFMITCAAVYDAD